MFQHSQKEFWDYLLLTQPHPIVQCYLSCCSSICFMIITFALAPKMVELSEEARNKIIHSQDFVHFFDHAARIIEKAIYEEDFAFDYGAATDEGEGLVIILIIFFVIF